MTNHDIVQIVNLYDHWHIWQPFRLSGSTFVGMICIKYLKVCKSVFCERNVSMKAMYIRMAKLGTNGLVTCFTKIHISLWSVDQIRWGLHNVDKLIFSLHEIILWSMHYFQSYPCGKSGCNFFWDIWYTGLLKLPGRDGSWMGDYATCGSCHLAHAARFATSSTFAPTL